MAPCFMSISIIVTAMDLQGHPSRTIIFQTIDHMFPGFDGMGPFPGNQSPTASSIFLRTSCLRTGLLLLLLPQSKQTDTRDLDDLETNTGNITLGLALTTETSKENLVVLVDEVQATVVGDESGDLLAVLNQLDLDTLPNGRVGLLGLNSDLFEDDALGVGGTTEGRGLESSTEKALLVVQVGPALLTAVVGELARGIQTTGLSLTHLGVLCSKDGQRLETKVIAKRPGGMVVEIRM